MSIKKVLLIIGLLGLFFIFFIVGIVIFRYFGDSLNFIKNIQLHFKTAVVIRGDIKAQLFFPGKIDAEQDVTLEFQQIPVNGTKISWLGVKVGDHIKKGQLIAALDPAPIQKQMQKNLNSFWQQRITFDQSLSDNGISHPYEALNDTQKRTMQTNQASLDSTVYDVELQDQVVRLSNLWSPIDGILIKADTPVANVNIMTGDQIKFEVVNPDTIVFNVDMDQTEVGNLRVGDQGIIILDAYPTETIVSTVKDIAFNPHVDSDGNTLYTVKMNLNTLNNIDYKYRMGMTGQLVFFEIAQKVLYIPTEMLHEDDNGSYVKVGPGKRITHVLTGVNDKKNTEIISGLNEGDEVYY